MITPRRAEHRYRGDPREPDVWRSVDRPDRGEPLPDGLGALEIVAEHRLPANARIRSRPRPDLEVVSYVREGALAFEDALGHAGLIQAGEFQRFTAGRSVQRSEANPSPTVAAHIFQVWLYCPGTFEAPQEQRRFSAAQRRGGLCVVASPDSRRGSLRLYQDAVVYTALLARGQHVVHPLAFGRSAWLHVVEGEVTLGGLVLTTGDGAGLTSERSVSLTAREATEILLLDLGPQVPRSGSPPVDASPPIPV